MNTDQFFMVNYGLIENINVDVNLVNKLKKIVELNGDEKGFDCT